MSHDAISNLRVAKPGEDITKALTSSWMNTVRDSLLELWEGKNLKSGSGISITPGRTVTIAAQLDSLFSAMEATAVCNDGSDPEKPAGTITITFTPKTTTPTA